MSIITIIGAGTLGGTLAHAIASQDFCQKIRIVDDESDVAAGKALDLSQAGPIECFGTTLVAGRAPEAAIGADVIILTGPASQAESEWDNDTGIVLLKQVTDMNRHATIILAGAGHWTLVESGVTINGIDRRRLLGSGPEAYRSAVRAIVALEIGCPASEVALTVLGRPPCNLLIPWSQASVAGMLLENQLTAAGMSRLQTRLRNVWPPGPYALASAAAHVAASVSTGNGQHQCCFVVMDGEFGARQRAMVAPVLLNSLGIDHIIQPSLNVKECTQLESAKVD